MILLTPLLTGAESACEDDKVPTPCERSLGELAADSLGDIDTNVNAEMIGACDSLQGATTARVTIRGTDGVALVRLNHNDVNDDGRHSASGGDVRFGSVTAFIDCRSERDESGWIAGERLCFLNPAPEFTVDAATDGGFEFQLSGNWYYGDRGARADLRALRLDIVPE